MQCCTSFVDLVEKGIILEKYLIDKVEIKTCKKNMTTQNTSNDQRKYWARKKNATNDGVIDAKEIHIGLTITLKGSHTSKNTPRTYDQIENVIQNTQE